MDSVARVILAIDLAPLPKLGLSPKKSMLVEIDIRRGKRESAFKAMDTVNI